MAQPLHGPSPPTARRPLLLALSSVATRTRTTGPGVGRHGTLDGLVGRMNTTRLARATRAELLDAHFCVVHPCGDPGARRALPSPFRFVDIIVVEAVCALRGLIHAVERLGDESRRARKYLGAQCLHLRPKGVHRAPFPRNLVEETHEFALLPSDHVGRRRRLLPACGELTRAAQQELHQKAHLRLLTQVHSEGRARHHHVHNRAGAGDEGAGANLAILHRDLLDGTLPAREL
mmetsp:Transcript_10296/g.30525  ORF Transcript_10296/g.30525 Transcript_10296/m.30525 type:complete len:233 (-) Transcript_10296:216-914(-)